MGFLGSFHRLKKMIFDYAKFSHTRTIEPLSGWASKDLKPVIC